MSKSQFRPIWLFCLPILLLLLCNLASAQLINGSIAGEVKDSSGAFIPHATVTAKDTAIGVERTTITNSAGAFIFTSLPQGTYEVTASANGFKKLTKTEVFLSNGDHLNLGAFALVVGATGEVVTVTADAGELQVQSVSGERSDTIDGKQLVDLGTNGRMFLDYLKIIPGVTSTFNGAQSNKGGLGNIWVNGARSGQTGVTIDGMSNVDNGCNCSMQITINPDAISEIKVVTSNYQAEYGKSAAGTVSIITKSGSNQFHGNARWFHRNEGLNAEQWFDKQANGLYQAANPDSTTVPNPKQKYRYNYAGYQIGGPVLIPGTEFNKNRDKVFFFWSQEYYRQLLPDGFDYTYVPTLDEINGNFANSTDGYGNPIIIKDPRTGTPYTGNRLPANLINTQMQQALLKVYPRPNITDPETCTRSDGSVGACNHYNYITDKQTTHPRREDIARLDYQLNSAHRLSYSFTNNAGTQSLPEGLSPQGTSNFSFPGGMFLEEPGYATSLHLTSTLSNTMVNDLTAGWTVNKQRVYSVNGNVLASKYNLDIPLLYQVAADSPIPDFSFGGVNGQNGTWSYLGSIPWKNSDTAINLIDNITKTVGRHTLKAGVFVERNRKDQSSWGNANGTFSFRSDNTSQQAMGLDTGDPYANALLGNYTSFQQQNGRIRGLYRYTNLEFFAQDTFRLTHRLTLDYGLRMAWVQPQFDANNQVYYFDPSAWDPAQAVRLYRHLPDGTGRAYDPSTGAIVSGALYDTIVPGSGNPYNGMVSAKNGLPGGFKDRGLMPEPRIGFAYDVFGNTKTVLRGGFGISHDRFQGNPIYNLVVGNPPNAADPSFGPGTLDNISTIAGTNAQAPVGVYGFAKDGKVPTIYSYSLGIQQDIGWKTVLDVSYVGNRQVHLSQKHNLNAIPYGTLFTAAAQDPAKYANNGYVVTPENGWINSAWSSLGLQYIGDNAYDQDLLAPYQGYKNIEYWTWDGIANYNSLQVAAHRRFGSFVTFGVAYTFSKALTTATNDGDWTSIINPKKYNYALAGFDRPQNLAINYVVTLPKFSKHLGGSKLLSYLTDGYQWEGIGQFMSGTPGTIGTNFGYPWGGGYSQFITGSWTEPVLLPVTCDPTNTAGTNNPYAKINPNCFGLPQIGTPTPQAKQYFRNGGTNRWDMSIFKNIPLDKESRYIQLRLEAFNVFNHPQFWGINTGTGQFNVNGDANPWDWPNGVFWSQSMTGGNGGYTKGSVINPQNIRPAGKTGNMGQYFGEYNSGGDARVVQLGLKLYF